MRQLIRHERSRNHKSATASTADNRLRDAIAHAVTMTDEIPPALQGCRGRIRSIEGRVEVWADDQARPGHDRPDRRATVIAGGVTLHDLLTGLAAHGVRGVASRFPDPERPGLLATIRTSGWAPPRGVDIDVFTHTLARAGTPHTTPDEIGADQRQFLAPIDGLQRRAAHWGVRLSPAGSGSHQLVLSTDEDTPAAWLSTGEALSALLADLVTIGAGPRATFITERARPNTVASEHRRAAPQVLVQRIGRSEQPAPDTNRARVPAARRRPTE